MHVIEEFISVNTSPAEVEKHLMTQSLVDQWMSPLFMLEPVEGAWMAVGSTYILRMKTFALAVGARYTVAERDSSHVLLNFDGAIRGTNLWHWFSRDSRTVIHNRIEYEVPNPVLRVFIPTFGALFTKLDMRIQMLRLQSIIEGDSSTTPQISAES